MQLRELLKTQQLLNPLVSAKNTSQAVEWDAFSQLLAQKNTQTPEVKPQTPMEFKQRPNLNVLTEKKFSIKVESNEPNSSKVSIERATTKQEDVNVKEVDKPKSIEKEKEVEESDSSDDSKKIKDKLKTALKQKLKNETGLDEQQIDALLANMNLDIDALNKLLENSALAGNLFTELASVLETLEIDSALNLSLSEKDVKQVVKQIESLIESLSKLQNNAVDSKSNQGLNGQNEGKAFEMKIIQELSRIVSTLNNSVNETNIKPEEIVKSIVDALSVLNSSTVAQVKGEVTIDDTTKGPTETLVPIVSTSSNQNNMSSMNDKQNQQSAEMPESRGTITSTNSDVNAQTTLVNKSETLVQNSVSVEGETVVEDNKVISLHQMVMKQSNAMTSPTIMPSGQVKQEIFTQIIDAIKGQIKLSDHGTSLIVKLQPEQLGNVELKLNIQKGIVLAEIKVENEIVKAAIESNLDDLKQSLSNKGYSVDQINVSVDSGKKDQQQAFEFNGQERKNKQTAKKDEIPVGEVIETTNRYVVDEYEGSTINYYG